MSSSHRENSQSRGTDPLIVGLVNINPHPATIDLLFQICRRRDGFDVGKTKAIYCDLNPGVFHSLRSELPNAYVLVMHERLLHHCNKLNKDTGDGLFNEKSNHIKRFNAIVKSVETSLEQLGDALGSWWRDTSENIKSHFLPLWNQIKECLDGCLNPKMHDGTKSAINAILDIIKGFRKNNVHFDIMILKTWFRDEAVIKRVKQTPFGNHMSMACCFSYDEGDYGVDIEKLKRIYLK